jgi:tetratricopeptide (TPR) repeat protein
LALGKIEDANSALKTALEKEPTNPANKGDKERMDTAIHQHEKIAHYVKEKNYEKAVDYCKAILETCIESLTHISWRMEYLLRAYKLKDAIDYAKEMHKQPAVISANPKVRAWIGRIFCYSGNEALGKQLVMSAL